MELTTVLHKIYVCFCVCLFVFLGSVVWFAVDYNSRDPEPRTKTTVTAKDDVEISANKTPTTDGKMVIPVLRTNWFQMRDPQLDPKTGNVIISYRRPTYSFPRPATAIYSVSNSPASNGSERNPKTSPQPKLEGIEQDTVLPKETGSEKVHPNAVVVSSPPTDDADHLTNSQAKNRRRTRSIPEAHSTEPENPHKRVKKGSVVYPGPLPPPPPQYPLPGPMTGPNYHVAPQHQPQQQQFQQRGPLMPPPNNQPAIMQNPNMAAMPPPPQLGSAQGQGKAGIPAQQPQPQRPFGPAIFPKYYANPNDVIKTEHEPFHIHMALVSANPQPLPDMEEIYRIALQYKNPLDESALLPEENRQRDFPVFLFPLVLPGKRSTRQSASEEISETPASSAVLQANQRNKNQRLNYFSESVKVDTEPKRVVNPNEITEDSDEIMQEQERQLFLNRMEDQLKMLARGVDPDTLLRRRRSTPYDSDISSSNAYGRNPIRTKRGLFRWIKNLFHKKQPEPVDNDFSAPEPVPVPQIPRRPDTRPSMSRGETTTRRSRPPPEVMGNSGIFARNNPKPMVVHEKPTYISKTTTPASTTTEVHLPKEPVPTFQETSADVTPSHPKAKSAIRPDDDDDDDDDDLFEDGEKVDKLLPVSMRSTSISESSSVRRASLNKDKSSKRRTDYADSDEDDFSQRRTKRSLTERLNPTYARQNGQASLITSLSKQEMTLLHELLLTIVSRRCQVNRMQLSQVGVSIHSLIENSRLPAIPFSIQGDPIAARLVQQLMTCRALIPKSPFELFGYNPSRFSYLNAASQVQARYVNNRLGNDVDEGDPVTRTKRGKRSTQQVVSLPVTRLPAQLDYLLRVQFLITEIVQDSCSSVVDPNLLKIVGDLMLQTVETTCRKRQCYSAQEQAMSLDTDLQFCPRRIYQQGPVLYRNPSTQYFPNHAPYVFP